MDDATDKVETIKQWLGTGSINLFGRPFAGKDTQCQTLASLFNGVVLSGGQILRDNSIPRRSRRAIKRGDLIPTDDYIAIVLPYLAKPEFTGKPLLLSSVGRWHGEEEAVMKSTELSGHPLKAVICLDLSEAAALDRWQITHQSGRGSRTDDAQKTLGFRFKVFQEKTEPVLDYYRQYPNLFIGIDANQSNEQVTSDILEALFQKASS